MSPRRFRRTSAGLALLALVGSANIAGQAHAAPAPSPAPTASPTVDPTTQHLALTPTSQSVTVDGKPMKVVASATAENRRFTMAGITWTGLSGSATFQVRTRTDAGWSTWRTLDAEPDGVSASERHGSRQGTELRWFDTSTAVEARVLSTSVSPVTITNPRLSLVDSEVQSGDGTLQQQAEAQNSANRTVSASASGYTYATPPTIINRASWGADPSLLSYNGSGCVTPTIDTTIKAAIVHNTAGVNDYTAAQSASIVRGIYAFHVQDRGWCDIGYNFLVDKYGQVFEGRHGGAYNPVHGAHATLWNTNTVGVSVMMDSNTAQPTPAAMTALTSVIAWKLAGNYRDPLATLTLAGKTINRIARHGDVMDTDCPGTNITAYMPTLRQQVLRAMGNWQTPIYQSWQQQGGESGSLGSPHVMERAWNGGRTTTFTGGGIFQTPGGQVYTMGAAADSRYLAADGFQRLGWPTGSQTSGPLTGQTKVPFSGGTIYTTSATGAHVTTGVVDSWLKSHPSEFAHLGSPSGEATGTTSGTQNFATGMLQWNGSQVTAIYGSGLEGDLNGDRVADVLTVDQNGVVGWYPTSGSRSGSVVTGSTLQGAPFTWVGQVPDVNGDGYPELVARRSDGTLWAWNGTGAGHYTDMRQVGRGWNGMRDLTVVPDMTHDGLPEVIAIAADGRIIRYGFNRQLAFSSTVLFGRGWQGVKHIATVGDLRNAGVVDVLAVDGTGSLRDYFGTKDGTLSGSKVLGTGFGGYTNVHSIGDVNGDGRWDLTVRTGSGPLLVMLNQGNGTLGQPQTLLSSVPSGATLA